MSGPHVVIIVPPLGPGQEPQTITVDIQGPKQVYIIGDGMFGIGFQDAEDAVQSFSGAGDKPNEELRRTLAEATEKIAGIGKGSSTPDKPKDDEPMSDLIPGVTEANVKALKDMGFDDEQIKDYYKDKLPEGDPQASPAPAPGGGIGTGPAPDAKDPMPGVPVPDLKDMESTEERVGYLETLEDKSDLGNQKLALGLFRNAKDEARQDLVDRICDWMGLPEMIVESQAPKGA